MKNETLQILKTLRGKLKDQTRNCIDHIEKSETDEIGQIHMNNFMIGSIVLGGLTIALGETIKELSDDSNE